VRIGSGGDLLFYTSDNSGKVGIYADNDGELTVGYGGNLKVTNDLTVWDNLILTKNMDQIIFTAGNDDWWIMSKGAPTDNKAFAVYSPSGDGGSYSGWNFYVEEDGDVFVTGNLNVDGTVRIRPPIGYKKTTTNYEIPNADEGKWIDDPMGSVTVTINGPSTLWIVYRGRLYAYDHSGSCNNAHSFGYSKISVSGTDYNESKFAWEVSTGEGKSGERGFISTLLVNVSCASYPCTKTIKGRIYVKDGTCPCGWPLWCDVRQHLVERNLFVEAFKW
jgi:hypothetical protein